MQFIGPENRGNLGSVSACAGIGGPLLPMDNTLMVLGPLTVALSCIFGLIAGANRQRIH